LKTTGNSRLIHSIKEFHIIISEVVNHGHDFFIWIFTPKSSILNMISDFNDLRISHKSPMIYITSLQIIFKSHHSIPLLYFYFNTCLINLNIKLSCTGLQRY